MGEIQELQGRLTATRRFAGPRAEWVIALHSSVSPAEQRQAFRHPPRGVRKVVLATNIGAGTCRGCTRDRVALVVLRGGALRCRRRPALCTLRSAAFTAPCSRDEPDD